jgi:hypothetical protein
MGARPNGRRRFQGEGFQVTETADYHSAHSLLRDPTENVELIICFAVDYEHWFRPPPGAHAVSFSENTDWSDPQIIRILVNAAIGLTGRDEPDYMAITRQVARLPESL